MNKNIKNFRDFKESHKKPVLCYLDFLLYSTGFSFGILLLISGVDHFVFHKTLQNTPEIHEASLIIFLFSTFISYKLMQFLYSNYITKNISVDLFINDIKFCNEAIKNVYTTTNSETKKIRLSQFLENISKENSIKKHKKDAYYFLMHMDAYHKQLKNKKESENKKAFLNNLLNK